MKTVLPSTFKEAELEAIAPSKPRQSEDESISQYFVNSRLQEIELNVRQTEDWAILKNDLSFVEFASSAQYIPIQAVIADRDRPGKTEEPESTSTVMIRSEPSPSPLQVPFKVEATIKEEDEDPESGDQAMDMASEDEQEVTPKPEVKNTSSHNILDSFERALNSSSRAAEARSRSPDKEARRRRSTSRQPSIPAPPPVIRNQRQEDLLAALGVEGSPRHVFTTPGPAYGEAATDPSRRLSVQSAVHTISHPASRPESNHLAAQHGMRIDQMPYGPNNLPPPPPPPAARSPSYDPWKAHDMSHPNARDGDSPKSVTSQHTAVGSDFHTEEDLDKTPRPHKPTLERSVSSRKRTFDEVHDDLNNGRRRQHDDVTPKMRRFRPKVPDAYR